MNKTNYDVDYFIDKFTKIPADDIGEGDIKRHCALYHVNGSREDHIGYFRTDESDALAEILNPFYQSVPYHDISMMIVHSVPYHDISMMIVHLNDATSSLHWIDQDDPHDDYNSKFHDTIYPMLPKERILFALQIIKKWNAAGHPDFKEFLKQFTTKTIES